DAPARAHVDHDPNRPLRIRLGRQSRIGRLRDRAGSRHAGYDQNPPGCCNHPPSSDTARAHGAVPPVACRLFPRPDYNGVQHTATWRAHVMAKAPWIDIAPPEQAKGDLRRAYDRILATRGGRVPPIRSVMAGEPLVVEGLAW